VRRWTLFALSVLLGVSLRGPSFAAAPSRGIAPATDPPRVIYSLAKRRDDKEIIALINAARTHIYFAMYLFTLRDIADALVAAKRRGVDVRGLVDAGESATSYEAPIIAELRRAGIPIEAERHADGNGIMHIKAMVTEGAYAVGSYNWTESGTRENDELLEIGTDPAAVAAYERVLKRLLDRYAGNSAPAPRAPARPVACWDTTEAPAHIGEHACVSGRLVRAYTSAGGTVFLDFCENYKGCPFSGVIFADDATKFGDLSRYAGKTVTLTGIISSYRGRAEIKLSDPGQLAPSD
jgi:PLD-like domain